MMSSLWVAAILVAFIALWLLILRIVRKYVKFPAPSFIALFLDSGFRKKTQPPEKVVACSGIKPGMQVLEIGCGSGAFTIAAARVVGPTGKIYALDIQKDMLNKLNTKLAREDNRDIKNIEIIQKSAYELPFTDSLLDLVFMVTVLQEVPDKQRALLETRRVLKPGGILSVTEYLPDPDYPWRATTEKMVNQAGFVKESAHGNIWSYTVRFRKP